MFTERNQLTLTLAFSLDFEITETLLIVSIDVEGRTENKNFGIGFPLNLFGEQPRGDRIHEFIDTIKTNLIALPTLRDALTHEALLHFTDTVHLAGVDLGLEDSNERAIISQHTRETAKRLKHTMSKEKEGQRGQPSRWDVFELTRAVKSVLVDLPKNEARDYENVARRLKAIYPDRAPKNGESLRKLMKRLDVNWMKLKTGK